MQNDFYDQLKSLLHESNVEKAYKDSNFYLDFLQEVETFLENKSDEERKKVIDGLYKNAVKFRPTTKLWSYHLLTIWLQDRRVQYQSNQSKTIISVYTG